MEPSHRSRKTPVELTLSQKLEALKDLEALKYEEVAKKYKCSRAAIGRLKKNQDQIKKENFISLNSLRKKRKFDP